MRTRLQCRRHKRPGFDPWVYPWVRKIPWWQGQPTLGHPMDRGPWWATVHGVAKSQTQMKWFSCSSWATWEAQGQYAPRQWPALAYLPRVTGLGMSLHSPNLSHGFPTGSHIHPCTQPHCLLAREHVDRDVGENNTKASGMPPTKGKGKERLFSFSQTIFFNASACFQKLTIFYEKDWDLNRSQAMMMSVPGEGILGHRG